MVTLVFADLIGSTTLHERIDAESAKRVMARYYAALSAAVESNDGVVIKLLGDGVLAGFGVQRANEDDAVRSVRTAVAMHEAMTELSAEFSELAGELGLRIGINTGEVVVSDEDDDVVGDPVNVAARLQHEAHAGEVLIGDSTRRLVEELVTLEAAGEFALKGRSGAVAAYKVVSLEPPATAPTTTFVGREDELRRILATQSRAARQRRATLAVIVGSPGLGKSRLMDEVHRRLIGEATVLTARCDADGGPTFTPIADALRALVSTDLDAVVAADEPERDRIIRGAIALCAGEPGPPEETFWVVRRVLGALARRKPVVLALDDLHWAEPLLLDLIEHLVEWTSDVPLMVLGAARPELRETRSSLTTTGEMVDEVIALDGLDAGAATRLAADAIGAAELPAAVAGRVLAASEGNPLFLGALVRMLVDDSALRWDGERWVATVDLDDLDMPPTIHALLAARIDRLEPSARLVLERASVIGRQFSRAAVMHLLPHELHADLDATLESLRRSELVEPDATWFLGEPSTRFHHALIRDAAYRRLLRDARADLHATFAEWLEERVGEATDQDEAIGTHLEQAYHHLRELGPLDDRARALGSRAAERLAAEGRRALARDDLTVAAGLLGRAVSVLEAADAQRPELLLDWCEALLAGGDVSAAAAAIDDLGRSASDDRVRAWHTSFLGQLAVLTDPQGLRGTAESVAAAADTLRALGDAAGEAKAHSVRALALARLGEVGACESALDDALVAARRADDRRRSNAVLAGAPVAALWGPSPVTRASGRCLDVVRVLRITAAAPAVEAVAMRCQAVLEALRGRGEAARRMIASSRKTVEDLGLTTRILEADMAAGLIELTNGDPAAAEIVLRPTYHGFRDRKLGVDAAQAGALLGRALLALGRISEAESISHECEALAGDDLKASIAWRGVRAEALARRGEYSNAIEFARDAVALAADTDALLDHADARVALAVALRVAGQHTEADAELAAACELWTAKGATALLAAPDSPGAAPAPSASPAASSTVRPNRATANADRMDAAIEARDLDAVAATLADDFENRYHPLATSGGRDEVLDSWRLVFDGVGTTVERENLATLGDALALCRWRVTFESLDGGPVAFGAATMDQLLLIEVDADGRRRLGEVFDGDDLTRATARLHERHAEGAGAGNLAFGALLTSERRWRQGDWEGVLAVYDADRYVLDDRRSMMHVRSSGEEFVENLRFLFDDGAFTSTFEAARGDRLALVRAVYTSNRQGAFSSEHYTVAEADGEGRLIAMVVFDIDDGEEAYAELDARHEVSSFGANAATRMLDRFATAIAERDLDVVGALVAPDFRSVSRRRMLQDETDRNGYLEFMKTVASMESAETTRVLLATRGDRLAMMRLSFRGRNRSVGASEVDLIEVVEVDTAGRRRYGVSFDVEDVDAAYAELDRLYAEGEGAPHRSIIATFTDIIAASSPLDTDEFRRLLREDFTFTDRARFGSRTPITRDDMLAIREYMGDAGTSGKLRLEHVPRLSSVAAIVATKWIGTWDGAAVELQYLVVIHHDGHRVTAWENFDCDDFQRALARYEELTSLAEDLPANTVPLPSNAASRASDRTFAHFDAHDWASLEASTHPDFVYRDNRNGMHTEFDTQQWIESMQLMVESNARSERRQLSVLGDGVMLEWVRWTGTSTDPAAAGARFEVELLRVVAVDDSGLLVGVDNYDVRDRRAANEQLWRLYEQSDEGQQIPQVIFRNLEAFNRHDLTALRATLRDDFVFDDRRRTGSGALGAAAYVDSVAALLGETDDLIGETLYRVVVNRRGTLSVGHIVGTDIHGGDFENLFVRLVMTDGDLISRLEVFETDDLDQAVARFDALSAEGVLGGQRNACGLALQRLDEAYEADDFAAFASHLHPSMVFDDRRALTALVSDGDVFVRMMSEIHKNRVVLIRTPLSEPGDRLALDHLHWRGPASDVLDGAGEFELDFLGLHEVDENGLVTAVVIFATQDRAAANDEIMDRFRRSEEGRQLPPVALDAIHAVNHRDLAGFRATLAHDFCWVDHRPLGSQPMGRDDYVQFIEALITETSDFLYESVRLLASSAVGGVDVARLVGRTVDHAEFDIMFVRVVAVSNGQLVAMEVFPPEDVDAAQQRFEELQRELSEVDSTVDARLDLDSSRVPATSATRTMDRWAAALAAKDRDAMVATCSDVIVYEDRRSLVSSLLDRDEWIETMQVSIEANLRVDPTYLSTLGDRLVLAHERWRGDFDGSSYDGETLTVREVDAEGLVVTIVTFDIGDRVAANDELRRRFRASEGAVLPAVIFDAVHAVNHRDIAGIRATMADDFALVDHRPLGVERMDADGYLEFFGSLLSETSDSVYETIRALRFGPAGAVDVARIHGHTLDGAVYEIVWTQMTVVRDGRLAVMEMFASDEVDAAVARFEELTGGDV